MASTSNNGMQRLAPLHGLSDYKVANKNLDVRGWEVVGADGKRIGKVDDLIVDTSLMKVRYLDVDVDKDLLLPDVDTRHTVIPIGAAHLDEDSDQVFLSDINHTSLARFPFYKGGAVNDDLEHRVMHALTNQQDSYTEPTEGYSTPTEDFYSRDHFDEERFYNRRDQDTDGNFGTRDQSIGGNSVHDDIAAIERLRQMLEEGTITPDEFSALKRKAISGR